MPLLRYKTLLDISPELKTPATADFPRCALSTTAKPGNMLPFSVPGTLLCILPQAPCLQITTLISTPSVPLTRAASEQCHPVPHLLVQLSPPTLGLSPGMSGRLQARPPPPTLPPPLLLFPCTSGPRLTRPGLLPIPQNLGIYLCPCLCNSFFLGPWWSLLHFLSVSQKILSTNFFCLKNPI